MPEKQPLIHLGTFRRRGEAEEAVLVVVLL